jgi:hypothetical protein
MSSTPSHRHSLHYFSDHHQADNHKISKLTTERYVIGLLAGVALFYVMGKALGLGQY